MSERLSQIDSNPFHDSGIRGLQRGLNKAGAFPQLKEDGKLGPKTISAWKRAAAENPAKLNQSLDTGSMENRLPKIAARLLAHRIWTILPVWHGVMTAAEHCNAV